MLASFEQSSHRKKWLFTKEYLKENEKNLYKDEELELNIQNILRYFVSYIQQMGKEAHSSQKVVEHAIYYFKRLYTKVTIYDIDPHQAAMTCYRIALKFVENSFGIDLFRIFQSKSSDSTFLISKTDESYMEYFILPEIDFDLVIYVPSRILLQFCADSQVDESVIYLANCTLNDTYFLDFALTDSPYAIAIACLYFAATVHKIDLREYLGSLTIDLDRMFEMFDEIKQFYLSPFNPEAAEISLKKLYKYQLYYQPKNVLKNEKDWREWCENSKDEKKEE